MQLTNLPAYLRNLLVIGLLSGIPQVFFAQVTQCDYFKWVKYQKVNINDTIPGEQIRNGAFFLLIDRQVNAFTRQSYFHYAYKLISEQGVQENSEISIDYIPAYQKFYLHGIRVIRNGKLLDRNDFYQLKEIQKEEDLDEHIYDENKTVYIILKDIRPGDIIDYDFTIEGFNPVFRDKLYVKFSPNLEYSLPHFYYRILMPAKEVKYKYFNDAPPPHVIRSENQEEWIWDLKDRKPVETDDMIPSWYTNYPMVEVSGFTSWKEVEQWGMDVFSFDESLDPELLQEINAIKSKYSATQEQVIAALRFVQKKIRYLGIEIGMNSHKPNSPNKVFRQRFGDCKDKSLLLCTMLQQLGVEAYPALVNTWMSSEILNAVPSAMIFNHTVVKAVINKYEFWFDPAISTQEGDLNHTHIPDYEYGLVLDGNFNGLNVVPNFVSSKTNIKEKITVKDFNGNAELQIITEYQGNDADNIRYSFTQSTLKEIQKNYLEFYRRIYDSISVEKSLYFKDDTLQNLFTTFEKYKIKDFWKKEKQEIQSFIYPYTISEKIQSYSNTEIKRESPLYLEFPLNIHHSFTVIFPQNWNLAPFNDYVTNEYFYFNGHASCDRNICKVDYNFQTYKKFVPASDVELFLKDMRKIGNDHVGMTFTYNNTLSKSSFGLGLFLVFLLFLTSFIYFCIWLYRKREPLTGDENIFHPTIGGWMVLPVIGLILTPVISLITLISGNLFNASSFQFYTSQESSGYHILWGVLWMINLAVTSAYLVLPVLILVMIFKYDQRSPSFIIWFYAGNAVVNLILLILAKSINTMDPSVTQAVWKDLIRAFIAGAIWIPYFYYSSRVKETFVR